MSKTKKILITYFDNGDFKSKMEFELLWSYLVEANGEIEVQNRSLNFRTAKFKNGTIIKAVPFRGTQNLRGERATHVYVANNSPKELLEIAQTIVVEDGNYEKLDTEGLSKKDRVNTYSVENNRLKITNL